MLAKKISVAIWFFPSFKIQAKTWRCTTLKFNNNTLIKCTLYVFLLYRKWLFVFFTNANLYLNNFILVCLYKINLDICNILTFNIFWKIYNTLYKKTHLGIILVNFPQIINIQLGLHVLLPVKRYERHFQLLIPDEIQGLLDLADRLRPLPLPFPRLRTEMCVLSWHAWLAERLPVKESSKTLTVLLFSQECLRDPFKALCCLIYTRYTFFKE